MNSNSALQCHEFVNMSDNDTVVLEHIACMQFRLWYLMKLYL